MPKKPARISSPWNICRPLSARKRFALQIAGIASILLCYTGISYWQHNDVKILDHIGNPRDTTIPGFRNFVEGLQSILETRYNGDCWLIMDLRATMGRLIKGMVISTIGSVVLGIFMGCYRAVESFFNLIVAAAAREPATAMLAAFFVLLGTGENLYVGVIVFGTLPVMTQTMVAAVHEDVHREAIDKMLTFNASPPEQIYNLVYKQILPTIIDVVRVGASLAMIGLLAAEMQVGDVGFGYRMKLNSRRLDMSVVYIYLGILVLLGYALDSILMAIKRRLCPWFGSN